MSPILGSIANTSARGYGLLNFQSSATPIIGAYDALATVTVPSGGVSSITFSGIPSTYTHLQLRGFALETAGANGIYMVIRANSDSGANYSSHSLYGNGSGASANGGGSQTSFFTGPNSGPTSNSNPTVLVMDLLDYSNTSKYKTFRTLIGCDNNGSGSVDLASGSWQNTSAITSLTFLAYSQGVASTFAQYSTFSLYGVR